MSFQFLSCEMTCVLFLHMSQYVSTSKIVRDNWHAFFVRVFACQKWGTYKTLSKIHNSDHMWKILSPKIGSYIWATHGTRDIPFLFNTNTQPCANSFIVLDLNGVLWGFTPREENVIVTMEFEVPKRCILRPTLSTNMVQHVLWWERQKKCSGRKNEDPWQRNIIIHSFIYFIEFFMKTWEEKRMIKLEKMKQPFWGIY